MRALIGIIAALLVLPLALAIWPGDPGFRGCIIADTIHGGQYEDLDCDKQPDVYDNCPFVPNPDQIDRDENGDGDACDLVIDELELQPDEPVQGRSFMVNAWMSNYRQYPMRNLVVRLEAPRLGISTTETINVLNPGDRTNRELLLRIPACAPVRATDFVVIVEYPYAAGQREVFSEAIRVPIRAGECGSGEEPEDDTIVNILQVQDVDPVDGALYPFTIHNNQPESKAYILTTELIDQWGASEIHPGSLIIVPPGEARDGAVQVWAYPDTPPGDYAFMLTIQAKDDVKQIQLLADVPEVPRGNPAPPPAAKILLGLLAFIAVLALLSLLLVFTRRKHKEGKESRSSAAKHFRR